MTDSTALRAGEPGSDHRLKPEPRIPDVPEGRTRSAFGGLDGPEHCSSDGADDRWAAVTFERLWAEAITRPGSPAIGLIRDAWAGPVGCAIQFDEGVGAVVLDFPADRLLAMIEACAGEAGWHVSHRSARPSGGRRGAMRYVMTLVRKLHAFD
jgi:hypothetical protein